MKIFDFTSNDNKEAKPETQGLFSGVEILRDRMTEITSSINIMSAVIKGEKAASVARYGKYMTNAPEFNTAYSNMLNQVSPAKPADKMYADLTSIAEPKIQNSNEAKIDLKEEQVIYQMMYGQILADDPIENELQAMIVDEKLKDIAEGGQNTQQTMAAKAQSDIENSALSAKEAYANIAKITE